MTLVIETGAGIRDANSYVDSAFVSAYLTDRGRETDWDAQSAAVQDAKVLAAADHMEKRWASLYRGTKQFVFDQLQSKGTISVVGQPSDANTLSVGQQSALGSGFVYVFRNVLSTPAVPGEILIGANNNETASNIFDALTANAANAGTTFSEGTPLNREVTSVLDDVNVNMTATAPGASGDFTILSTNEPNLTLDDFKDGYDGGSQQMSFPRLSLVDRSGILVLGVPLDVKQAQAEYAERARVADLDPDPTVDPTGAQIESKREKVGPIEEETTYVSGTHLTVTVRPYPAADRLLKQYTRPAGVIR